MCVLLSGQSQPSEHCEVRRNAISVLVGRKVALLLGGKEDGVLLLLLELLISAPFVALFLQMSMSSGLSSPVNLVSIWSPGRPLFLLCCISMHNMHLRSSPPPHTEMYTVIRQTHGDICIITSASSSPWLTCSLHLNGCSSFVRAGSLHGFCLRAPPLAGLSVKLIWCMRWEGESPPYSHTPQPVSQL